MLSGSSFKTSQTCRPVLAYSTRRAHLTPLTQYVSLPQPSPYRRVPARPCFLHHQMIQPLGHLGLCLCVCLWTGLRSAKALHGMQPCWGRRRPRAWRRWWSAPTCSPSSDITWQSLSLLWQLSIQPLSILAHPGESRVPTPARTTFTPIFYHNLTAHVI